jgi:hypothetical protein
MSVRVDRKRKRSGSQGGGKGKKQKTASAIRQANMRTAGFLGVEHKFWDTGIAATTVPGIPNTKAVTGVEMDPAVYDCLNSPGEGTAENERSGRSISMSSLHVTGTCQITNQVNETARKTLPAIFIALVLDTQTNGSQLNSEDVYTNPSAFSYAASSLLRNLEHSRRFRILATQKVPGSAFAGVTGTYDGTNIEISGCVIPWEFHVDLKGMKVNFGSTGSGVSTISDNSIHLIACSTHSDTAVQLFYNARLRFFG